MANKHRSRTRRVFLFTGNILLYFILFSVLWVLLYLFLPPPVTATMILDGNGITKYWVSLNQLDPDMPRAAIGAEDSRFRSEEHTSELKSLMRISYAVFCVKKESS